MLMHAVLGDSLEHYSSNPRSITLRNTETVNFGRIFLQIMETRVLKAKHMKDKEILAEVL